MSYRESNIRLETNSQQDNRTKKNIRKLHEFSETISQKIKERYGGGGNVDNNIKINTDIFYEKTSYAKEKIKGGI